MDSYVGSSRPVTKKPSSSRSRNSFVTLCRMPSEYRGSTSGPLRGMPSAVPKSPAKKNVAFLKPRAQKRGSAGSVLEPPLEDVFATRRFDGGTTRSFAGS